ncbi:cytochrome c oxidase subunit II [Haloarcula litorea]|uniref:cytochrome c oxidase subunit II n=1 Tax=Haloarcula litorea TaxID=3032579 RepID=UPI0023E77E8A|nr:cytochrome c oxidase subunit II [Halomicroarcula sp. GDY20]
MPSHLVPHAVSLLLQGGPVRSPKQVFNNIFEVFLWLGTAVGIVVILYTLYHAVKYRESASEDDPYADKVERPSMGELPQGGSGGRKVFYSFGISAVIVISLIAWTYSTLLYIEQGPPEDRAESITVEVEGFRFGWEFIYPNNYSDITLRVPEDRVVRLRVTSRDVFHNFGIPEWRVKTDAIPGMYTDAWFVANETGTYQAKCYELCGSGHSQMVADVQVMPAEEFDEWYAGTNGTTEGGNATSANGTASLGAPARAAAPAGGVPA